MKLYCGIDLHSNNSYVVLLDEDGKVVYQKRLSNDIALILKELSPYREMISGIVVESTYNWYWLVDGLASSRLSSPSGKHHGNPAIFRIKIHG